MAGIGFELKKLFRRKGLFASLRAYGYAGIICTGPMLLGVALQMGILLLCGWVGAERAQQDLLVCMITYTLLFSLTVTSFFSMPVTRYLADMLYEEREQAILPSFWGSSSLMLVLGCSLYGLFLLVSGATLLQGLLCLWLFAEMIVNWNGMSYLTAIKDYRGILCSFLAAIGLAFGLGLVLVVLLGFPVPEGMLFAVAMGYGLMMVWDVVLLYRYFPQSDESPWTFLKWVDEFLPLAFTGPVHQHWPVCPPRHLLGGAGGRAGQGPVLRGTLLRCPGPHRLFDHPHHQHQLCGVGGGQLLPQVPGLLQPLQRWRRRGRHRHRRGGDAGRPQPGAPVHGPQAALCHGGGPLAGGDAAGLAAPGLQRPDGTAISAPSAWGTASTPWATPS